MTDESPLRRFVQDSTVEDLAKEFAREARELGLSSVDSIYRDRSALRSARLGDVRARANEILADVAPEQCGG